MKVKVLVEKHLAVGLSEGSQEAAAGIQLNTNVPTLAMVTAIRKTVALSKTRSRSSVHIHTNKDPYQAAILGCFDNPQ